MQPKAIILLSCSHEKVRGGNTFQEVAGRSMLSSTQPVLKSQARSGLLRMREQMRSRLRARGQLHNLDQKGGFRDERDVNQNLRPGPDFGGTANAEYMLAYERYNGRFFQKLRSLDRKFWEKLDQYPVEILFVSGLYGLLFWNEAIQDYDCHMGDIDAGDPRGGVKKTVAEIWRPALTEALCDYINGRQYEGAPISDVFNLLSEDTYERAIEWRRLSKVRVHHRNFDPPVLGPDSLAPVARLLHSRIGQFGAGKEGFKGENWEPVEPGPNARLQFRFLNKWTSSREAILGYLSQEFRGLAAITNEDVRTQMYLAEVSRLRAEQPGDFDRQTLIVSYTKCIEYWLNNSGLDWRSKYGNDLTDPSVIVVFDKHPKLRHFVAKTKSLWGLRNRAAHGIQQPRVGSDMESLDEARRLAFEILAEVAKIKLN